MADKTKKPKAVKGQHHMKPDNNDPEQNPLLHIDDKVDFSIETGNLLQSPDYLIYPDYEAFDLKKDKDAFDVSRLDMDSTIVVILVYYEYVCTAKAKFSYVKPLMESGFGIGEVFRMIRHALKNKLLINVPTFDNVFEPEIIYLGKIKY